MHHPLSAKPSSKNVKFPFTFVDEGFALIDNMMRNSQEIIPLIKLKLFSIIKF